MAKTEMSELLASAQRESRAELARLYLCVHSATAHAFNIVLLSRVKKQEGITQEFVDDFVRLEASLEALKSLEGIPRLLGDDWPRDPGFTLGASAGWSALETGWTFAESILGASLVARAMHRIPTNGKPYASQKAVDECGPDIVAWAEGAMKELRDVTLPLDQLWPSAGSIRRDTVSYPYKLRDEYDRAAKPVATFKPNDQPRPDGLYAGDVLVYGGAEYPLPHKQWLLLEFMWGRDAAPVEDVREHVWPDDPEIADGTLRSLCSNLNNSLLAARHSRHFGIKQGQVLKS